MDESVNQNHEAIEALISKIFTVISSLKSAYIQLQTAHTPYDPDKIQAADKLVVSELKNLSELQHFYREHYPKPTAGFTDGGEKETGDVVEKRGGKETGDVVEKRGWEKETGAGEVIPDKFRKSFELGSEEKLAHNIDLCSGYKIRNCQVNLVDATLIVALKGFNDRQIESFKLSQNLSHINLLKGYCDVEYEDRVGFFMEPFDATFMDYVKQLQTESFECQRKLILDYVRGLVYLDSRGAIISNFDNSFLVSKGIGKLINLRDKKAKMLKSRKVDSAFMLAFLGHFEGNVRGDIQVELKNFKNSFRAERIKGIDLPKFVGSHPFFMNNSQRVKLIQNSFTMVDRLNRKVKYKFSRALLDVIVAMQSVWVDWPDKWLTKARSVEILTPFLDWERDKAKKKEEQEQKEKKEPELKKAEPVEEYRDDGNGFYRFARNLVCHGRKEDDEVINILENLWPNFLHALFWALCLFDIEV